MKRRHALVISLMLGTAVVAGTFGAVQRAGLRSGNGDAGAAAVTASSSGPTAADTPLASQVSGHDDEHESEDDE